MERVSSHSSTSLAGKRTCGYVYEYSSRTILGQNGWRCLLRFFRSGCHGGTIKNCLKDGKFEVLLLILTEWKISIMDLQRKRKGNLMLPPSLRGRIGPTKYLTTKWKHKHRISIRYKHIQLLSGNSSGNNQYNISNCTLHNNKIIIIQNNKNQEGPRGSLTQFWFLMVNYLLICSTIL